MVTFRDRAELFLVKSQENVTGSPTSVLENSYEIPPIRRPWAFGWSLKTQGSRHSGAGNVPEGQRAAGGDDETLVQRRDNSSVPSLRLGVGTVNRGVEADQELEVETFHFLEQELHRLSPYSGSGPQSSLL